MSYPKAIGPYSVYREFGKFIFISGQLPIKAQNLELISDDIKEQSEQALNNLVAVLEENQLSTKNIIKTTCFLSNMSDFSAFNEVYAKFFQDPYPTRSTFAVKELPKGAKIEIEAIAYRD